MRKITYRNIWRSERNSDLMHLVRLKYKLHKSDRPSIYNI